jgi:hypothetical protein
MAKTRINAIALVIEYGAIAVCIYPLGRRNV